MEATLSLAFKNELCLFLERIVKIFLSYASEDQRVAEEISLALAGEGHQVFFDRASLPAAGEYNRRIREAIYEADVMIFLVSSFSVSRNSYALSELQLAKAKWTHPNGRLLPIMVSKTNWDLIPEYLKAVTILQPEGNIGADVAAAFSLLAEQKSGVKVTRVHTHNSRYVGAGVIGFILGIAIAWWVQPQTTEGIVVLVVLATVIVLIVVYVASWLLREYRRF